MTEKIELLKKPFKDLTTDELKQGIQDKFGTLSRFCRITKRQTNDFNMLLRAKESDDRSELLKSAYVDAKKFKKVLLGSELTEENRNELRLAIYDQHTNISAFCKKYKHLKFNDPWICNVLNSNAPYSATKITTKVKKLASVLKVEFNKTKDSDIKKMFERVNKNKV